MPSIERHTIMVGKLRNCDIKSPLLILVVLVSEHRIGISEHKIQKDTIPSDNIKIAGYEEFVFDPTGTTHGGTGFYIRDNLDYIRRDDLKINSPTDYESTFVEIIFPRKKNLIIGCIIGILAPKFQLKISQICIWPYSSEN